MLDYLASILDRIFGFFEGLYEFVEDKVVQTWEWLIEDVARPIWDAMSQAVLDQLPQPVVDQIESVGPYFETMSSGLDLVNYIIPIYATLAIVLAVYSLEGLIMLIRWIIKCIPTLNLG